MPDENEFASIVDQVLDVLERNPAILVSDIDGTISHLALTPDAAFVEPAALEALESLSQQIRFTGLVTGRSLASARTMIGDLQLPIIANHGYEVDDENGYWVHPQGGASVKAIGEAIRMFSESTEKSAWRDDIVVENKGLSASFHFRNSLDPVLTEKMLHERLSQIADDRNLRVTAGKMVLELRPAVIVDKGSSLLDLVKRVEAHGIVFLGDDLTDIDGFIALRELSRSGVSSLSIAVAGPETPESVMQAANLKLDGVEQTTRLLTVVASGLSERRAQ